MFIELVDALRCPNAHEESWLVASANRMEARHIVSGTLGCPVCRAEYPIEQGVVDFRRSRAGPSADGPRATTDCHPERSEGSAFRLAALLNLSDASGFAVLLGDWGALAHELSATVETPLIAVDPPEHIFGAPGISVLRSDGDVPLANNVARAIALDARAPTAVRVVKQKGRVVGAIDVAVPDDVTELARDEDVWVGERQSLASPLIALHVRRV